MRNIKNLINQGLEMSICFLELSVCDNKMQTNRYYKKMLKQRGVTKYSTHTMQ
jgi:hypothetical protein